MHAAAIAFLTYLGGATSFEFFPEDEGGILVIAYRGNESFEILARSDGLFEVSFENNAGLHPAKILDTFRKVQGELEQNGWQLRKSSGSYTHGIIASKKAATRPLPLGQLGAVYQSSTPPASPPKEILVAPMRSIIIPAASGDHPRYSGVSKQRNLLLVAS
jgi:hypothetical protein